MVPIRASEPPFMSISHLVLVRLMVALVVMTIFVNLLLVSVPPETSSSAYPNRQEWNQDYNTPNLNKNRTKTNKENSNQLEVSFPTLTKEQGRKHILEIFQEAGVQLTPEMEAKLPTWEQVQEVVGTHPYILGLDRCQKFRDTVPAVERMLGSAGMFNTGTNLVTHLLKQNCEIPERVQKYGLHQSKESYGMRWQVPWGKHTPAKYKNGHATEKASASGINKDWILPVVTIRNPYTWFQSMCHNGYTAKWKHGREAPYCPLLLDHNTGEWNNVSVHYGGGDDHHLSLAHLWNDWYRYYLEDADYPFVVVRMEDLVFYPKETTKAVCECAGGKIKTDLPFHFIVDSAKADSPGHDKSTGIFAAWVKYSKRPLPRNGFTPIDYEAAIKALNGNLMKSLGYNHPPDDE